MIRSACPALPVPPNLHRFDHGRTTDQLKSPRIVRDLALLLTRFGLGVVLIAHGWQKFDEFGLDGGRAHTSGAEAGAPA